MWMFGLYQRIEYQEWRIGMKELFAKRISNLLSVKSIVTIACTAVFAYQAVTNSISQDFMTIYAVIIAFYFGTQAKEASNGNG